MRCMHLCPYYRTVVVTDEVLKIWGGKLAIAEYSKQAKCEEMLINRALLSIIEWDNKIEALVGTCAIEK